VIVPHRRGPGSGGNHKLGSSDRQNFLRRIASAVVLAPLALGAALVGGSILAALCTLTAALVLWEWSILVTGRPDWRILAPGLPAICAAAIAAQSGAPGMACAAAAFGAIAAAATTALAAGPQIGYRSTGAMFWAAGGVVYAAIVLISPIVLRSDPERGFAALAFLFATVWATDIFAYFSGRGFGGPLLAPRLSPKKTWAGAVGGLAGGVVAGVLVAYASAGTQPVAAGVLALILSIAAQAGDLLESSVKRRFGAKDASALIPGHGGVMDRVDGLLVAALIAVAIGALRFGAAASARGLLLW
jgi:phosphatidate cytidylyltransferase